MTVGTSEETRSVVVLSSASLGFHKEFHNYFRAEIMINDGSASDEFSVHFIDQRMFT